MSEEYVVDRGNAQRAEGRLDIAIATIEQKGPVTGAYNADIAAAVVDKEQVVELGVACGHDYLIILYPRQAVKSFLLSLCGLARGSLIPLLPWQRPWYRATHLSAGSDPHSAECLLG